MKKFIVLLLLNLVTLFSLFATTNEELKKALDNKEIHVVQALLENAAPEEQSDLEKLVLTKSKEAVSKDDLDYASSLAEIVLMVNFDNTEAQKLYTSIDKAKKTKAETEARKKAEEEKRQEEERKRKEAEEEKRQLEEYKQQKQEEEQKKNEYIESVSKISFANFPMLYAVNLPIEISHSSFADQYNGTSNVYSRLGFGLEAKVGFNHPYVRLDLDLSYNFLPLQFKNAGMKSDFKSRFTVGLPSFSDLFRLSLGLNSYSIINDKNAALYSSLTAPTIGIGLNDIKILPELSLSFFTDLSFITFDTHSEIGFAWDAEIVTRYILPVQLFKGGKLFVQNTTSYNNIIVSKQNEWYLDTQFSIGVSINE